MYENSPCNEKDGQLELGSGDFRSIYTGFRNTKSIGSIFVRSGCQLTVWKGKEKGGFYKIYKVVTVFLLIQDVVLMKYDKIP